MSSHIYLNLQNVHQDSILVQTLGQGRHDVSRQAHQLQQMLKPRSSRGNEFPRKSTCEEKNWRQDVELQPRMPGNFGLILRCIKEPLKGKRSAVRPVK